MVTPTAPLHPDRHFVIGIDLGGTNIVVSAMSLDGSRLYGEATAPTLAREGAEAVVARMAAMVEACVTAAQRDGGVPREAILGIGLGAPGTVDRDRGLVLQAPNLQWQDYPLVARMTALTGLPVRLDNDANCATYGEWWLGAARGGRNVIGLTIGTGVGGGVIIDRRLYHGSTDAAGEIGHITVDLNGRRCGCGNYGCLEAYASGSAIAGRAREALAHGEPSLLPGLVQGKLEAITAATVYKAAAQGDAVALELVRDTARFLGTGIANLLNIFNPDVVVLAGGVTQAGEALFGPLRTEVRRRAFKSVADACRIVPGTLPGTAGVVGAVASFIEQTTGQPPA
jgi:glucokinase